MNLGAIFDGLTTGELSKVALGGARTEDYKIKVEDYKKVIPAINMAIMEIHKRIPLRTETIMVALSNHITLYKLKREHAVTNADTRFTKYLLDSCESPFNPKVLRVDNVTDAQGNDYPLNEQNNRSSLFTPTHNVVQHPYPLEGGYMDVHYRTSICEIPRAFDGDPYCYELDIPDFILAPILTYVQARLEVGMVRNENAQAQYALMGKFEQECEILKRSDLVVTNAAMNTNIHDNGWT